MGEGQDSARARLAAELRALRESTAEGGRPVTFRELAARTHFGAATLNKVTTGKEVPTWPVVEAFVRECGGDPEGYRELWEQARTETTAPEAASPATAFPEGTPLPKTATAMPSSPVELASASGDEPDSSSKAATPRPRRVPSRVVAGAAIVALLALVALAAVLITSPGHAAPPPASAAPASSSPAAPTTSATAPATAAAPASTAQISSPPGPTIGFQFNVAGTVSSPPSAGRVLWEVTLENDDNRFYPLKRACVLLGDQQFNCGAAFAGQEVMAPGQYQYTVLVVDADPDAVAAFEQYNQLKTTPAGKSVHGMPALPTGGRIIGQKTVTRS